MSLNIRHRDSALINRAYKKLVIPDLTTRICGLVVTLVDSLIAARFVGNQAMAAIALITPIILFNSCLHDILASGISPVIISYKSRGQTREAQRAFGAITAHAFLGYVIVYALAAIFAKDLLQLFTTDPDLIAEGVQYFLPLAICNPLAEMLLCFERGFRADGRTGFFGFRGVLTNILNVVFSLLAVTVFHGGVLGISIAANLASLAGYFWSFSYIFSKKCTIHPDFTVLLHFTEFRQYLKEEFKIGSVFALDDGLCAAASSVLNKAIILTGGTAALTAVGVYNSVETIIYAVTFALQSTSYNLCNLFWSDGDYDGAKRALHSVVIMEAVFAAGFWGFLNLFPGVISTLFNVEGQEVFAALRVCLCFSTAAAIFDCYTNLFSSYMLASEHKKAAAVCATGYNLALLFGSMIGFLNVSFATMLFVYMLAAFLSVLFEAIFIHTRKPKSSESKELYTCSYTLDDSSCAGISREISELLARTQVEPHLADKLALLSEECSRLIQHINRNQPAKQSVYMDYRLSVNEKEYVITVIDSGDIFDPVQRMKDDELPEEYLMSKNILQGFSPKAKYARVVDLNISHLIVEREV